MRHELNKGGVVIQPLSERAWEIHDLRCGEDGIDLTRLKATGHAGLLQDRLAAIWTGARHWDKYLKRVVEAPPHPSRISPCTVSGPASPIGGTHPNTGRTPKSSKCA